MKKNKVKIIKNPTTQYFLDAYKRQELKFMKDMVKAYEVIQNNE